MAAVRHFEPDDDAPCHVEHPEHQPLGAVVADANELGHGRRVVGHPRFLVDRHAMA